ncbi:helix-turn-helix transcriptional regulator [Nocardia sp. alder85J]|uniref:helix-turn-helix transcriptional regulator n=1 Tax=Nocardia sp. alder85J TaxID=2862949 RepID=UPI001CD57713|nr:helix-turn-helix domain-containing protein [Nocardia sp. alder85J]MCX4095346.1 helix-turn-helix domain-containing protein [Nocardia sp. alder85J]
MESAGQMREYLSTREVSALTGIAEGTLRYWRADDRGPACCTLGRKKVVYKRSELEKWLAEQESASRRGGNPEVA